MLASWIILFSLCTKSHGVSLGSIVISLNPMIDYVSDLDQLNSLFNASWIPVIPAFGWSPKYFIYHVNARSYSALTKVAFLMLSSVMPWASHTAFTTNQNWLGSSFPAPLNTGNLTALYIPTFGGDGGGDGVGEDGFDVGEVGDGVDGCGISGKRCLINQTTLLGENLVSSSSLSHEIEINRPFSNPSVPL